MIRRSFLILIGMVGLGLMTIVSIEPWFLRKLYYKIEGLFKSPVKPPPNSERKRVEIPSKGYAISVETALNSRCNSDYDENPKKFHWGMFDETKKLSDEQIKKIVNLASIPRLTDRKAKIQSEGNILTFVIVSQPSCLLRDWMMVESGMQQQATALTCAALGVGMVFKSLGDDGTTISETESANIKLRLDPMKPNYHGSFWSNSPPASTKPWLRGNLPDPSRDGKKPLLSVLEKLEIENGGGKKVTDEALSQLLWAARGRTPHFYKSRPWGMTIPTSRGKQDISSVYLISDYRLSKYVNWHKNRPTHSLEVLGEIRIDLQDELIELFPLWDCFIVLGKNEDSGTALWEIGYQLLNLLTQANALDISYRAFLLDEKYKSIVGLTGVKDPVAILAI